MSFTYTTGIPATNNDPSVDQPDLLINTNSVNSLLDVDHVSFNAQNGGTHKQVRYSSKNTPGAQTDPQSTAFTANGTADPTVPQHFWKNSQGTYPLSALKAFVSFDPINANGAVTPNHQYNIQAVNRTAIDTYTIELVANSLYPTVSKQFVVFAFQSDKTTNNIAYTFTSPTFTLTQINNSPSKTVNFAVLQI